MDDEFIRAQIELAGRPQWTTVTAQILATCWPGGTADRTEPVALRWLRRWRPATANLALPACSCGHGRCAVCN